MKALESTPTDLPVPIRFKDAFLFWLKLGFISFGGPAGQIAIMHQELVEKRHWISEQRFLHALNYCMLLPGPEAQQLATYIGWLMHRSIGGIVAGLLFILPSLFLLMLLSWVYLRFGNLPTIASVLYGIKPAVTAIILFAAYRIGVRALKNWVLWTLAASAFAAVFIFHLPFPMIVFSAGFLGMLGGKLTPHYFTATSNHQTKQTNFGKAIIDDDTPMPDHAKFSWRTLIKVLLVGVLLWAGLMLWSVNQAGWNGGLAQMGWFFTKAAFLTFGGAYAVLPYVYQGVVEQYQWLTAAQMMDGLALGETTPGPLIMIVTFVGFLGGWQNVLGDTALSGAIVAALVATYFTFLPSFIFILAGGPLVESTYGNLKFTAPLLAITSAVVGVIVNLAIFFAESLFFPLGLNGTVDTVALLLSLAAFVALFRYKVDIILVITVCGLLGFVLKLPHNIMF